MIGLTWVLGILYTWISWKIARALNLEGVTNQTKPDGLSVIIPFRNEESRIHLILNSLAKQKLPECPVEVIFVDDGSTDQSVALINQTSIPGLNLITILSEGEGKPAALGTGHRAATYSWLVTTDADMMLPAGWLKNLVAYTDQHTDLICGVTLADKSGFAGSLQTLETTLFMAVAAGMHRLGHPVSATGNSMAFRVKTIESVGGFESVKGSPREDYALYQLFAKQGATIRYRLASDSVAQTPAEPTLPAWLRQRRRWFGLPAGLTPFSVFVMTVFSWVWLLFFLGVVTGSGWITLSAYGFKLAGNLIIVKAFEHHTGHRTSFLTLLLFELVWVVPLFLLLVNRLINPVVVWKGRRYG